MRTGKTRQHYERQKSQCYAYFRVSKEDLEKMRGGRFTIYDFMTDSFSFSQTKKQLAAEVLEAVRKKPLTFTQLVNELGAKKSTLYLLCLSLERSGMVEKHGPEYRPSRIFSDALAEYSKWWANWLKD